VVLEAFEVGLLVVPVLPLAALVVGDAAGGVVPAGVLPDELVPGTDGVAESVPAGAEPEEVPEAQPGVPVPTTTVAGFD
jgi:hypothetical protein